jgi:hypothetical protein
MGEFLLVLAIGGCIILGLSEVFKISSLQVIRDMLVILLIPFYVLFLLSKPIISFLEGEDKDVKIK